MIAVLAPASSATKVSPLQALRAADTTSSRRDIGPLRWVTGLLLTAGATGTAGVVISSLPKPGDTNYNTMNNLYGIVGSAALAFFALVLLGPVLLRPLLRVLGWPLRQLGPVGRLAVGGVGAAPRRAAAVCVVVALGVTLLTGLLVSVETVRVGAASKLASSAPADFELHAGDAKVPAALVEQARDRPELTHVTPYRLVTDLAVNTNELHTANDLDLTALPSVSRIEVRSGSLADLGPGRIVLSGPASTNAGLSLGDLTTLRIKQRTTTVTVAAILSDAAPLDSQIVVDPSDLDRLGVPAGHQGLLADAAAPGVAGRTAGRTALQQLARGHKGLDISVLADQRDELDSILNLVLTVAAALLGLTVIIAVVGVGTTTALSVVERSRESSLLRAVGLSRRGLRTMLTAESSLYGLIGATIGVLLGVPYAGLALAALRVQAPLQLPITQLATVTVAMVTLTALAGRLPARKATRISPLAALDADC